MMCIDWLTEMTGKSVCRATRSAVRCRVPDSSVGIVGSDDAGAVVGHDDRAVHLGQLAQPGRRQRDVQGEPTGAQGLDHAVVAEHDEGSGAAGQDPLQTVPERGAGGDPTEQVPQRGVGVHCGGHERS
jgi:hypothetical protein